MTRRPRIDFAGAFHHVYARGIEKRDIFADDADRAELRRRIVWNINRFRADCLAWAFLPNHFHLLYHSGSANLSEFMRCLMSGYSIYFNRKYERSGHLFQNRYKSAVIDSDRYLLELIRYIHLNPVRSGIVRSLESLSRYPWTGHSEIVASGRLPWEGFPFIRDFFSSTYLPALEIYLSFLEDGLSLRSGQSFFEDETGHVRERPGLADFSSEDNTDDLKGIFLDIVGKVSCQRLVSKDRILNGRRDRKSSLARREILAECVSGQGIALRSVCKWLGITQAGGLYLLKAADNAELGSSSHNG